MTAFQEQFAQALLGTGDEVAEALRLVVDQPGFSVYRNTVLKGCADALEANFPTVARLVGSDWFRAAAVAFARTQPPADSRLLAYGDASFAAFLQAAPSAHDLPYLAGVAQLDTLWRSSHGAGDAPVLPAAALATLPPQDLADGMLRPHAATRWAWFDALPVAAIWAGERSGNGCNGDLAWHGDGLLLTRPRDEVTWQLLPRAGCVFLDACAEGCTLGEAAQRTLSLAPDADLATVLQLLLRAGAFGVHQPSRSPSP